VSHLPGPHLRAPYAGDFGAGPNVCVTVPPDARITCLGYEDGRFTEVFIGASGGTGVYLTLPTAGLEFLIEELEAIEAGAASPYGVDRGSRWASAPSEWATNPARPVLVRAPEETLPNDQNRPPS
jgi:hypothetical protein